MSLHALQIIYYALACINARPNNNIKNTANYGLEVILGVPAVDIQNTVGFEGSNISLSLWNFETSLNCTTVRCTTAGSTDAIVKSKSKFGIVYY